MRGELTGREAERWNLWKRASDVVMAEVVAAITRETGLSGPDFSVLTRLAEQFAGEARQQRLSDSLGWERSRLSRQLARMEKRSLVLRRGTTASRDVVITDTGTERVREARLVHARAVRRALLEAVPRDAAPSFWTAIGELADPDRRGTDSAGRARG